MNSLWGGGGPYQLWADTLDRWQAGEPVDLAALPPLPQEDFTGDGFQRLADRVARALSRRLQAWADALTRAMAQAPDEFAVARTLGHARWGLRPIRALAAHPSLPTELATRLLEMVDAEVRSGQQALADQVEQLRRGGAARHAVEARLRTLRENDLAVVTTEDPAASGPTGWYADPADPTRRRIITTGTKEP